MADFKTARTIAKLIEESDFSDILKMYNEPDAFKYIQPMRFFTEEMFNVFLQKKIKEKLELKNLGIWVIRLFESNEFVGICNLNPFGISGRINIGCHIRNIFWNQGFANELIERLLIYAFKELKLTEVIAVFEPDNLKSEAICKRNGFVFEESQLFGETVIHVYTKKNQHLD